MMSPEDIAKLITEDLEPGTLGLNEEESETEPGDMREVHRWAVEISKHAAELVAAAKKGNVRGARAIVGEIGGALEQASAHTNRLADEQELAPLKPQTNK